MIAGVSGWILRHTLLFILLIAGMAIYSQIRQSELSSAKLEVLITRGEGATTTLQDDLDAMQKQAVTSLQDHSLAAIDARLIAARVELSNKQSTKPSTLDALRDPQAMVVSKIRHDFEIGRLEQEIGFLEALRANLINRGRALTLDGQIEDRKLKLADLNGRWKADKYRIETLPPRWSPNRYVREGERLRDLEDVYVERQKSNRIEHAKIASELAQRKTAREKLGDITAMATPKVAVKQLEKFLLPLTDAVTIQKQELEASLDREAKRWWKRLGIDALIRPAVWALLVIILTPFAIRVLFYWVLAPLASLQKPIRLLDAAQPIPLPIERSAVSKGIVLGNAEELLVKQGFLQTSSHEGAKATQWLLDGRHPISSLASGLWFLTRISGAGMTTVSAVRDPFAEITRLALPAGSACVLQPRAIVGVVQPIATPLRITSHWRLGTLNAWLTWQLRFLVFHGPADIILTGGRGVRVEAAEAGRSIGQDQLIGFSAGLSYSTGRAETFLPYFLGQESLLKDRIAAGTGILIAEEAPRAGQSKSGIKRGLEGTTDALLKVFGV